MRIFHVWRSRWTRTVRCGASPESDAGSMLIADVWETSYWAHESFWDAVICVDCAHVPERLSRDVS